MDLETLVRRAAQRDVAAFVELTRRFQQFAFGSALAMVGDVEHCVKELAAFIREYGLTDIVTWAVPPGLTPDDTNASLERFARDVAPRLRRIFNV